MAQAESYARSKNGFRSFTFVVSLYERQWRNLEIRITSIPGDTTTNDHKSVDYIL